MPRGLVASIKKNIPEIISQKLESYLKSKVASRKKHFLLGGNVFLLSVFGRKGY